ncbi:MAG: Na+/H+ antiporter NhaC [Hyphomicrobium sp.]|nr:Na+/H+ antiporter NhaC [Hyphomicrobium sp.]
MEAEQTRPPTLTEAIVPIAALMILVAASYYLFGDMSISGPTQVALVLAAMIGVLVGRRCGHTLEELNAAAVASVSSGIGAIFILFAVGALIGTWAMSGTLVAMVYYGLQLLSPNYFYATAALMTAVVSASIGTSWTTVGTVGIGLMGISQSMGLDPAITAGAVISGAYFGDTSSPVSDTANLAAGVTGTKLYHHLFETALISGLALAITLVAFWTLGSPGHFDPIDTTAKIVGAFRITPWLFLPLILVALLAFFKFPPFTAIFGGALAGGLLAVIVAPDRVITFAGGTEDVPAGVALLKGTWLALASGYKSTTGIAALDQLASRGGMASMLDTIWLVIAALAFGGIVEKAGVLERVIRPVIDAVKSTGSLIASLVASVFATNIVTGDQYIALVMPARMFKPAFAERGYDPVVLSRTVAASATPSSALIPWNSCGAYMAATLGVATFHYAPYAIFNYTVPLLTILLAYAGRRMFRTSGTSQPTPVQ